MEDSNGIKLTRREFLITGATSVAAATLPSVVTAQPLAAGQQQAVDDLLTSGPILPRVGD